MTSALKQIPSLRPKHIPFLSLVPQCIFEDCRFKKTVTSHRSNWVKPKVGTVRGFQQKYDAHFSGSVVWLLSAWRRHQMETFSALLTFCAEHSSVHGEFYAQRSVTRSFDVFFDLHLNKQLSKQWWGWWFETPSSSLWRQCNGEFEREGPCPAKVKATTMMGANNG